MVDTQGEISQGGPSEHARLCGTCGHASVTIRGRAEKGARLPGSVEAVIRADRVMPEELLAAVCTGFCTERGEKHGSENSLLLDTGTLQGGPGLLSI